ncbi:unnamed protein product, partial [Hymenolepis diminuta]
RLSTYFLNRIVQVTFNYLKQKVRKRHDTDFIQILNNLLSIREFTFDYKACCELVFQNAHYLHMGRTFEAYGKFIRSISWKLSKRDWNELKPNLCNMHGLVGFLNSIMERDVVRPSYFEFPRRDSDMADALSLLLMLMKDCPEAFDTFNQVNGLIVLKKIVKRYSNRIRLGRLIRTSAYSRQVNPILTALLILREISRIESGNLLLVDKTWLSPIMDCLHSNIGCLAAEIICSIACVPDILWFRENLPNKDGVLRSSLEGCRAWSGTYSHMLGDSSSFRHFEFLVASPYSRLEIKTFVLWVIFKALNREPDGSYGFSRSVSISSALNEHNDLKRFLVFVAFPNIDVVRSMPKGFNIDLFTTYLETETADGRIDKIPKSWEPLFSPQSTSSTETQRVKEEDVISSLMKDLCDNANSVSHAINIGCNEEMKPPLDLRWDVDYHSPWNLVFHCESCGVTNTSYDIRGRTTLDSLRDNNFESFGDVNFGQPQINILNETQLHGLGYVERRCDRNLPLLPVMKNRVQILQSLSRQILSTVRDLEVKVQVRRRMNNDDELDYYTIPSVFQVSIIKDYFIE